MIYTYHRGRYTDKQLIRLQETPDEIPAGEFCVFFIVIITGKQHQRHEFTSVVVLNIIYLGVEIIVAFFFVPPFQLLASMINSLLCFVFIHR